MSDQRNIPVPDELADVRAQIATLETREAELRVLLLANPDIREGANWLAEIKRVTTQRVDLKELRAMHPDIVEQYTFPTTVTHVALLGVTEDGELISARSMRKINEQNRSDK